MTNENLELSVTRLIDAPVETVWKIATERLEEWWCPKPWTVEIIEQDWRAGGRSAMVMRGPNGEEMPHEGVFLEVIARQALRLHRRVHDGLASAGSVHGRRNGVRR